MSTRHRNQGVVIRAASSAAPAPAPAPVPLVSRVQPPAGRLKVVAAENQKKTPMQLQKEKVRAQALQERTQVLDRVIRQRRQGVKK